MKRTLILLLITIMTLSSLTACDGAKAILGGGSDEAETEESPDVYLPMESVRTLNPAASRDEDTYFISNLIYEGLFELDETLAAQPVLAETYQYDEDGQTLVINLKQGIVFPDGDAFGPDDVKFSIEAYKSNAENHLYVDKVANISKATVTGNNEITIVFANEGNSGLENLTFPIIPEHNFRGVSELIGFGEEFVPMGTGPYMVDSYDPIYGLELKPNEMYSTGETPTNRLHFEILPSRNDAMGMLDVNSISFAVSKQSDRDTIYRNPQVDVTQFVSNEVEWIGFNFNSELMQDVNMRKAVASAINNKLIIESAYYNSGVESDTIYFPGFLGIGKEEGIYGYDEELATEYLESAGFKDGDNDGIAENDDGANASIDFLTDADNQSRVTAAETIKANLEQAGILCNINSLPHESYLKAISNGGYDIYIGGAQISDTFDLGFLLRTDESQIGYSNERLDKHLDTIVSGITTQQRANTFESIQSILTDEIPYYCLTYKTYGAVSAPPLEGVVESRFHDIYYNATTWKCVYEVKEEEDDE